LDSPPWQRSNFTRRSLSSSFWPKNRLLKGKNHPDLAPNDLCLFPKIKSALKERRFQDTEDSNKKSDDSTESFSTTGVAKMKVWRTEV
jgi:hypothetical protein